MLSLLAFMKCMPLFRGALGETAFFWLFGVGMFASFLTPMIVFEFLLQKDLRLRCPHCGESLAASVRGMRQLWKNEACLNCGTEIPVAKPTRRQQLVFHTLFAGGMLILLLIFWLVK